MSSQQDEQRSNLTAEEAIIAALRTQFAPLVESFLTPETEPALVYTPAPAITDAHS